MPTLPIVPDLTVMIGDPPLLALDEHGKLDEAQIVLLNGWLQKVARKINGGISSGVPVHGSGGNLTEQFIVVNTPASFIEFAVPHGLGRIPSGVQIAKILSNPIGGIPSVGNLAPDNAPPGTPWTDSVIYLLSSLNLGTMLIRVY